MKMESKIEGIVLKWSLLRDSLSPISLVIKIDLSTNKQSQILFQCSFEEIKTPQRIF